MQPMEVILPGGLQRHDRLETVVRFRELSGRVEQSLFEFSIANNLPRYVTNVLLNALHSIGYKQVDIDDIQQLSVPDRQFLMMRLAAQLEGEHVWKKVSCAGCGELFDVEFNRHELPVVAGHSGFPYVRIESSNQDIVLRVPTGLDQEMLCCLEQKDAERYLLEQCIVSVDGDEASPEFINSLSEAEIEFIEQSIEDISPAVCTELLVQCPECQKEQKVAIDHYQFSAFRESEFYDDIHTLASHYHWSEAEILELPIEKRRRYASMIARSLSREG